jgi:hypothetical protein
MPTADATLLPPAFSSSSSSSLYGESAEERGSARSLDAVGVGTVLGAMIEQKRRASQPSFESPVLPPTQAAAPDETSETDETGEHRAPIASAVFLKAR